jgi:hypothetical protein
VKYTVFLFQKKIYVCFLSELRCSSVNSLQLTNLRRLHVVFGQSSHFPVQSSRVNAKDHDTLVVDRIVTTPQLVLQQQNSTYSLAGMSPTRIFAAQTLLMEASKQGSNFEPWSPPSHSEGPMKAGKSTTGLRRSDSKPSPSKKGTAACVALAEIGIVPTRKRRPGTGPFFSEGTTTSPFANVPKVQRDLSSASVDHKTPLSAAFPNRDGDSASLQERKGRRVPTFSELKFSCVDKRIPNIPFLTPRYYLSLHFSLFPPFSSIKVTPQSPELLALADVCQPCLSHQNTPI